LPEYYSFKVVGNGFLKQMVRLMVGAVWSVGRGKVTLSDIQHSLESPAIKKLGPTAPPEGLYLTKAGMSNIVNKILNNGVFIEFLNEEKIISRHVASELKKGRLTETSVISMLKLLGFVIENKRDGNKVVKMNEDYDKTIKLYKRLGLNRLL
jgi:hypothetical protein